MQFNDIIFGSDDDRMSQKYAKDMQNEFKISLLGELSFFLGLLLDTPTTHRGGGE
jgi:hypothetical protein